MVKKTNYSPTALFKNSLGALVKTGATIQNYAAYGTGFDFLGAKYDTSIDKYHSPKARANILNTYAESIKIKPLEAPLAHFLKTITDSITHLEYPLEEVLEKIKDPEQQKAAKKITNKLEPYLQKAHETITSGYMKHLQTLEDLIKTDEVDNPRVIVAYINDQYQMMMNQLDKNKKTALEEATKIIELSNEISKQTKSTLIQQITDAYDKTIQELDTAFNKGKPAEKKDDKEITKAVVSIKDQFETAVAKAESELVNLVLFVEETSSKDAVDNTLTMRAGAASTTPDARKYRKISFESYVQSQPVRSNSWVDPKAWYQYGKFLLNNNAELSTPSGRRLQHDGQGQISITIPADMWSYNQSPDNLLGSDLLFLANGIKAQGKDEITFTIDCKDPKLRQKILEEAYYAAKLAGFPDDKIKFNVPVQGEDEKQSIQNKTAAEIGGRLGSTPQRAGQKAEIWKAERQELDKANKINLRTGVDKLDEKIQYILDQKIHAEARYNR